MPLGFREPAVYSIRKRGRIWQRGDGLLKIEISMPQKYVDIWLTHDDNPSDVQEYVREWKRWKPEYNITVFRSGSRDLGSLTADLLRQNKDIGSNDAALNMPQKDQVETKTRQESGPKPAPRRRKRKQTLSR